MKFPNFFSLIIIIMVGTALYRQFDFQTLRFEKLALSMIYLIVFTTSLVLMIKDMKKK